MCWYVLERYVYCITSRSHLTKDFQKESLSMGKSSPYSFLAPIQLASSTLLLGHWLSSVAGRGGLGGVFFEHEVTASQTSASSFGPAAAQVPHSCETSTTPVQSLAQKRWGKLQGPPWCCGQEFFLAGQGLLHTGFKGLTQLLGRLGDLTVLNESTSSFLHHEGSMGALSGRFQALQSKTKLVRALSNMM